RPDIGDVGTFLSGLAADIESAQTPERIELEYAESIPEEDPQLRRFRQMLQPSRGEQVMQALDELISPFDPLEVPDITAVERFKIEAIQRGYLPADTPIDSRW